MRKTLAVFSLALALAVASYEVKHRAEVSVIWTGNTPSCPAGYDLLADESAALAGRDSAHCVR